MYEKIQSSKIATANKKKQMDLYPSCNVEYVQENQSSKVWCTTLRFAIMGIIVIAYT